MQMVNKEEEEEEDGKEMKAKEVEGRKVEIDANETETEEKIRLLLSLIDQVRSGFQQKNYYRFLNTNRIMNSFQVDEGDVRQLVDAAEASVQPLSHCHD